MKQHLATDTVVALNFSYLGIISFVFYKLHGKPEATIIAVIGLAYSILRYTALQQLAATTAYFVDTAEQLLNVRSLLKDPTSSAEIADLIDTREVLATATTKDRIISLALSLMALICLIELWTVLVTA